MHNLIKSADPVVPRLFRSPGSMVPRGRARWPKTYRKTHELAIKEWQHHTQTHTHSQAGTGVYMNEQTNTTNTPSTNTYHPLTHTNRQPLMHRDSLTQNTLRPHTQTLTHRLIDKQPQDNTPTNTHADRHTHQHKISKYTHSEPHKPHIDRYTRTQTLLYNETRLYPPPPPVWPASRRRTWMFYITYLAL